MSSANPVSEAILRAAERQAGANLTQIGREIAATIERQDEPRDTGRLLSSFTALDNGKLRLKIGVFRSATAQYGGWLNRNTGVFGPFQSPIVPTRAKVLRWIDRLTGDPVFRPYVFGQNRHTGWFDSIVESGRTSGGRVRRAVDRGWKLGRKVGR